MDVKIEIKSDGSIPIVHIGGEKLNLVSLNYKWHTKTADPTDGCDVCMIKGFFTGEIQLRYFMVIFTGEPESSMEVKEL